MEVKIDPEKTMGEWSDSWRLVVGSGHGYLALRQDYLDHLRIVKEAIDCEYVRFHGILHDDVALYYERPEGKPGYNFLQMDAIYDALLEVGVRPFVELSFMPKLLASGEDTVFWWKGNISPPRNCEGWAELVRQVAGHCRERYGAEEVRQWYFEVWNEPNLKNFWAGTKEEYFELYRHAALAIKDVDEEFRVGGPATAGRQWVEEFIDFCRKEDLPLDFAATHAYCCKGEFDPEGKRRWKVRPARQMAKGMIADGTLCRDAGLELHYTEWNSTPSPLDPVHDTVFNAAFVCDAIARAATELDSMSYWTFSDIFEEVGPPKKLFHGGFGLLSYHGIAKPTFNAFAMLSKMGEEILAREEKLLATKGADGSVCMLAFNPSYPDAEATSETVDLEIRSEEDEVVVEEQWMDERAGNARAAWAEIGEPSAPSFEQIEWLHKQAAPEYAIRSEAVVDGKVRLKFNLPPNGVRLVIVR